MSTFEASKEQLLELITQVLDGRIGSDAVQEIIEEGNLIAGLRILKRFFDSARKTAEKITDPYWQAKAYTNIAQASADFKDFDSARKTAEKITDPYQQAKAYTNIAQALARTIDKE